MTNYAFSFLLIKKGIHHVSFFFIFIFFISLGSWWFFLCGRVLIIFSFSKCCLDFWGINNFGFSVCNISYLCNCTDSVIKSKNLSLWEDVVVGNSWIFLHCLKFDPFHIIWTTINNRSNDAIKWNLSTSNSSSSNLFNKFCNSIIIGYTTNSMSIFSMLHLSKCVLMWKAVFWSKGKSWVHDEISSPVDILLFHISNDCLRE